MSEPTDTVLRPTPTLRIRVTAVGALLRVEAAMIRDDERPVAVDLRTIARELLAHADGLDGPAPGASSTIYACRCCSTITGDVPIITSGPVQPGWGVIVGIDGPSAICPACIEDPTALDGFREAYPNATVRA